MSRPSCSRSSANSRLGSPARPADAVLPARFDLSSDALGTGLRFAVDSGSTADVGVEPLGELTRARERDVVAAVDLVGVDAEPLARVPARERRREQAVVAAQEGAGRGVRPRVERPRPPPRAGPLLARVPPPPRPGPGGGNVGENGVGAP